MQHLANEGAAVVVNYASSREGADRVVGEIARQGGKAIAVQADVAKQGDIERLFSEAQKAFGPLDILVNNAGIYEFSPLESITAEHFHKHFNLNVLGLLLASKEALKHFGSTGGSIIHELGCTRMGNDPSSSVVTKNCQAHDVKNLFVADGGPFVSQADKNPTWTILALAMRTGEYIADQRKAGSI